LPDDYDDVTDSTFSDSESEIGPSMSAQRWKIHPLAVSSTDSDHDEENTADVEDWTKTKSARNLEQF